MNLEPIARSATDVAVGVVTGLSPLAGMILGWATKTAWAVVDAERAGGDPVAVAQLAADRAVDLIEYLKAGKAAS